MSIPLTTSLASFLTLPESTFVTSLTAHHQACMNSAPSHSQIQAWHNCFLALQTYLPALIDLRPESGQWSIIFEYELPRERGRRPDLIILAGETILILEFKDYSTPLQAHLDQVAAYARDLAYYHAASHNHPVVPILVLTLVTHLLTQTDSVHIASPDRLPLLLNQQSQPMEEQSSIIDPVNWLTSDYAPLPTLISAARSIFNHQPLPQIRRAQSAGIPATIAELLRIAREAQANRQHHLALVTGVPGAGKTLVGLQFVYDNHFNDTGTHRSAVFLSGNGPLVDVLQYTLKSRIFVQDVHGFLKQYANSPTISPAENILIFDEAQRAFDADRSQLKRGTPNSEPDDFLRIGARKPWAFMIGLIGEGQEIHLGEEAGLGQWNSAITRSNTSWIVHCPAHIAPLFTAAHQCHQRETLNLTTTLRSHLAEDLHLWVQRLLEGKLDQAAEAAKKVQAQGFDMYLTTDLAAARNYLQTRYADQADKRFGILASSKARNLPKWGIQNGWNYTRNLRHGPWYNDPPSSAHSCCQLHEVATEFSCQGLELDFPIIAWGDDLRWHNYRWTTPEPSSRNQARNPHRLRLNSYRVLLTRGRDGFLIFIPPEPLMHSSYATLQMAGLIPLT